MGEVIPAPSEVSSNISAREQLTQEGYLYLITEKVQSGTIIGRSSDDKISNFINLMELPEEVRGGVNFISHEHAKLEIQTNGSWYLWNLGRYGTKLEEKQIETAQILHNTDVYTLAGFF